MRACSSRRLSSVSQVVVLGAGLTVMVACVPFSCTCTPSKVSVSTGCACGWAAVCSGISISSCCHPASDAELYLPRITS